jgi:hypothetical protein
MEMLDDMKESKNGVLEGYNKNHNWTHKNCLWELPYVKALILPHNSNLMHQERNNAKSIMIMCLDVIGFIERLMRVMFHVYFNAGLWKIFVELSYFYRQICAKKVSKAMMERLEEEIAVLICIMEKVFPPGCFNAMQHLLVHLPWEVTIRGPVQFR